MGGAAIRQVESRAAEEEHPAINAILGANPFVGLDNRQMLETMTRFMSSLASRPASVTSRGLQLAVELGQIAAGVSDVAPAGGDKRFTDPTWSNHPAYRRLMQTYLAWRTAMHELVADGDGRDWKDVEQQRFAVTLMTEALAPTNTFFGNPAALKRAFETAGMSLVAGARNFLTDLWENGAMPAQVDKRPFEVGKNLQSRPAR